MSNPRITVEVTPEQYSIIKRELPHGMQKQVFGVMMNDICRLLDEYGYLFIVAIMEKNISYRSTMDTYNENRALTKAIRESNDYTGATTVNS